MLSDNLNKLIDSLNIDTLIRQSESFMRSMTKSPIDFNAAAKEMDKIPALKPILKLAITEEKRDGVMRLIDSLLVGDDVTRGFNKAKTDKTGFFETYKRMLIAKAPAKLKPSLSRLTQESLTIGHIEFAFNGGRLREQELNLMNKKLGLNEADQRTLRIADQNLITEIGREKELKTIGHGYLLMSRNRRGEGLRGVRDIQNGGYIAKEELTTLAS